jgi:hypothetical protein
MPTRLARNFISQFSKSGVIDAELYDSITAALPAVTPVIIDGVALTDGMRVLYSNLAAGSNRRYQASINAGNITWTDLDGKTLDEDQKVLIDQGTINANNIVQIQGGAWKIANEGQNPAAGGGYTKITSAAGLTGTFEGDVFIDVPTATIWKIQADMEVKGNLFIGPGTIAQDPLAAGSVKRTIKVRGSVYGIPTGAGAYTSTIDMSATVEGDIPGEVIIDGDCCNIIFKLNGMDGATVAGTAGGDLTIRGNYTNFDTNTAVEMHGGLNGGGGAGSGGNGGNLIVGGNYTAGSIDCNGGNGVSGNAGNGGNVDIKGNAVLRVGEIESKGGTCTSGNTTSGSGGDINIRGDLIIPIDSTTDFDFSAGFNTSPSATAIGGTGGTLFVGGNIISKIPLKGNGGSIANNAGDGDAGDGGSITCQGDLFAKLIQLDGGGGHNAGLSGDGGTLQVDGKCVVNSSISLDGGQVSINPPTGTQSLRGTGFFKGGCQVNTMSLEDGSGVAIPVTQRLFQLAGYCCFDELNFEDRAGSEIRSILGSTAMLLINTLTGRTILHDQGGVPSGIMTPGTQTAISRNGTAWRQITDTGLL